MAPVTEHQGRLLVIRGGAIGDFVLTLPVLAALRAHLPQAHLAVLGYPHIASLAQAGGLADAVHPIEARGLATCFNARAEPPRELAAFFASFAVIVSYLYDPDGIFQSSVRRCSTAVFIQGPHRPNETGSLHAAEAMLKPLEQLAIFEADPSPRLRLSLMPARSTVGQDLGNPPNPLEEPTQPMAPRSVAPPIAPSESSSSSSSSLSSSSSSSSSTNPFSDPQPVRLLTLAIHPGSGSERKNWPEPGWAELLARLASPGDLKLLLVGGEAEGDRLGRLARHWPADRLEVARSLPLVQLARRLATCHAFAGHDSGITHLAAALGLPGLVLWGETNESVWRPHSDRMRLLRASQGLASLEVARVEAALGDLLARAERP